MAVPRVRARGKPCLRVEIEYDGETPHFGGAAWVRKGSETIRATPEVFQKLIDLRNAKVTKLQEWLNQDVYVEGDRQSTSPYEDHHPRWKGGANTKLIEVNGFYAVFEKSDGKGRQAEPIEKLIISWEPRYNRPKVIVKL